MFENYQKLIDFKQHFSGLQYGKDKNTSYQVNVTDNGGCIYYTIEDGEDIVTFIHVNGLGTSQTFNLEGYTLAVDTLGNKTLSANTPVAPFETLVAYKQA